MAVPIEALPRYRRRNWLAFLGDYVSFGLGLTFASTTTTLPAFVATLTDDKLLIGAVSSVWVGAWLLPQVFAANYLSDKPRKYPIMMWGEILGRPIFPLFVLWLLLGGTAYPTITLAFLFVTLAVFAGSDALVALAWFDLFARALPAETRGRLVGVGQVATGLAAVGVGAWIRQLLGPQGPPFPANYAIIFGMACVAYAASTISCALIVEPHEAVVETRPRLREFFPQLTRLLREDRAFGRVTLVRLLVGLSGLATPFYVVYATDQLGLPGSSVGLFAAATTIGTAVAGIVLGTIADRRGTHRVVQITSWIWFSVPVLVLALQFLPAGPGLGTLVPIAYFLLGMADGSIMLGFLNFVLEIAPPGQRPLYMGLTNTVAGLLIPIPMLGGLLLERTSYTFVFALAAIGIFAGAVLSMRLPSPRQEKPEPPDVEPRPHVTPAP